MSIFSNIKNRFQHIGTPVFDGEFRAQQPIKNPQTEEALLTEHKYQQTMAYLNHEIANHPDSPIETNTFIEEPTTEYRTMTDHEVAYSLIGLEMYTEEGQKYLEQEYGIKLNRDSTSESKQTAGFDDEDEYEGTYTPTH